MLIIECRDIAYQTTLVPQSASFEDTTDSEVISTILSQYRYSSEAKTIEKTNVKHETLLLQDTTHWDFINLRAEANGQIVLVTDGTIAIKKPGTKKAVQSGHTFTYGQDIVDLALTMDARSQYEDVIGLVWSQEQQAVQDIQAQEPGESSFGQTRYTDLVRATKQIPTILTHEGELAAKEMETLVASQISFSRIAKIQGKITIQGLPSILPDSVIAIAEGAKNFQGKAYVSSVQHKLANGNLQTILTLGLSKQRYMRKYSDIAPLPAAGMLPPAHGLQIGIVKKIVDDPQKVFRIFVSIPMIHTKPKEGIWCRIASFYASNNVGAFFMPEVGDEVVLGSLSQDPRHRIILGALYSTKKNPPIEADEKNAKKTIALKNGLALTFDDEEESITLQVKTSDEEIQEINISNKTGTIAITNGKANKILLGKQNIEISSQQDIILDAKGAVTIKAGKDAAVKASNAIDIAGNNVSVKANMKAVIEGATSTE
ncbi:MAG: type VI secretion system tip protein VgrG, partial [Bacteroidota bacterium]